MKKLLLALVTVFSVSAFADTVISVTPSRPVNCETENHRYVNWVYDIQKTSEDEKTATFEFYLQHGSCYNGKPAPVQVNVNNVQLLVDRNDFYIPGLQKRGTETVVTQSEADELHVSVVFDKSVLLKKKDSKKMIMFFLPGVQIGGYWQQTQNGTYYVPNYLRYIWNVRLFQRPDTKELTFTIH